MERPETRLAQEFVLDAFADPTSVRHVVRGILHTIFFHRYFPTIVPQTHQVLDLTLPYVAEPELETLIDQRTAALARDLFSQTTPSSPPPQPQSLLQQGKAAIIGVGGGGGGGGSSAAGGGGGGRGKVTVQFMEKTKAGRARRIGMWGGGGAKAEEEVCWERWTVRVTVAEPKTDSERAKVRQAAASTLHTTVMKIITAVNTHKDHIPPITIQEGTNPFPYLITVNQRSEPSGGGVGGVAGGMMRGFGAIF